MAETVLMQKALSEIRDLRARLAAAERTHTEPIAIVGIGCRFPGNVNSPEAFWNLLDEGRDAIGPIPPDRWDVDAFYDPSPNAPGKMYIKEGGFLPQVDAFDPQFFGVSPREAAWMDPQQRLLLEVSWEALEHAGCAPDSLAGAFTGVFVGLSSFNYASHILSTHETADVEPFFGTGNALSVAAGRLSYTLGLTGPAFVVDTACSSSLAALHLACESLRRGECATALAGGVALILTPDTTVNFCKAGMLAKDGRCKTFDSAADGYVRSEGAGILVLERLSDAVAANRRVIAVVRGSACNHDGRSTGLTVPNGPAQQAVIRAALANAGVKPIDIAYIEAHGTGTPLGDPVELGALAAVFRESKELLIGSVKTNLGHLEAAAGITGVIKVALAMQHGRIPAHLHFHEPTPHFPWSGHPLRVAAEATAWPEGQRYAGVSSFGFSGTNAHAVLERPTNEASAAEATATDRPLHIYTISARSEEALDHLVGRHLTSFTTPAAFPDRCYTANTGRSQFAYRFARVAGAEEDFHAAQTVRGHAEEAPRIAFLFPGQGSQYAGMGRELYLTHSGFRHTLDQCDELLRTEFNIPLLDILYRSTGGPLNETAFTQPALFALEFALAELWKQWGIRCDMAMGHSLGEYVAACVAGVFSWDEGLRLAALRGSLMSALPHNGSMAAVLAPFEVVEAIVRPYTAEVSVASINGPRNVVISGRHDALSIIIRELESARLTTQPLTVSHAFHSPLMEPIVAPFGAVAARVKMSAPTLTLISNVSGKPIAADAVPSPAYWTEHIRKPVQFAEGIRSLEAERPDIVVEIGPGTTLLGMARQMLAPERTLMPSLRPGQADWKTILGSLAAVYVRGGNVNWKNFDRPYLRRVVSLPTYPFERQRCWIDAGSRKRKNASMLFAIVWEPVKVSPRASTDLIDVFVTPEHDTPDQQCTALLERTKELETSAEIRKLWVVTRGAFASKSQSAVRGLARVIAIESPDRYGGMLDLDPVESFESQRLALESIVAAGGHGKRDLKRRNGQWYSANLRPVEFASSAVSIRPDATYLVTGGQGALGGQFAKKLIALGARRVVVLSRSAAPSYDPHIIVEQADVADRDAMGAVLRRIANSGAPLRGVVHAAGVLEDSVLVNIKAEQFARAFRPKVDGAWLLHELTAGLELNFFVLCSSAASILGAAGQGAYAAANSALDALAHHRRSMGLPAVSLNWGPWAGDTGMATDRRNTPGIRALDPDVATDLFARLLNPVDVQLLIIDADESVIHPMQGQTAKADSQIEVAHLSAKQRREYLRGYVQRKVAEVLSLPAHQLPGLRRGFFDMGFDSLLAVELRNKIQAELPVSTPSTLTFEYPTVALLAEYLDSVLTPAEFSPEPIGESSWDDELLSELELLEGVLGKN